MTKTEIIQTLSLNKQKLHDEFGLKRIGLFGSYAKQNNTDLSDIDFLIEFEQGKKKYKAFIALSEYLEKKFEKNVEMVTKESITATFFEQIKNDLIYVAIA
jgi:predicted nucleotidyltransferase